MEHLAIGAARAGRSVDDLDRPQLVVCSVDDDRDAALDAARLLVTQYLGQQPHIMKASGVATDLLDDIGRVLTWPATHEQVVAASKLVPDDVVQSVCAAGTADEVRAKVAEYVAAGCTCPVLYPLGPDVEADDRHLRGIDFPFSPLDLTAGRGDRCRLLRSAAELGGRLEAALGERVVLVEAATPALVVEHQEQASRAT